MGYALLCTVCNVCFARVGMCKLLLQQFAQQPHGANCWCYCAHEILHIALSVYGRWCTCYCAHEILHSVCMVGRWCPCCLTRDKLNPSHSLFSPNPPLSPTKARCFALHFTVIRACNAECANLAQVLCALLTTVCCTQSTGHIN